MAGSPTLLHVELRSPRLAQLTVGPTVASVLQLAPPAFCPLVPVTAPIFPDSSDWVFVDLPSVNWLSNSRTFSFTFKISSEFRCRSSPISLIWPSTCRLTSAICVSILCWIVTWISVTLADILVISLSVFCSTSLTLLATPPISEFTLKLVSSLNFCWESLNCAVRSLTTCAISVLISSLSALMVAVSLADSAVMARVTVFNNAWSCGLKRSSSISPDLSVWLPSSPPPRSKSTENSWLSTRWPPSNISPHSCLNCILLLSSRFSTTLPALLSTDWLPLRNFLLDIISLVYIISVTYSLFAFLLNSTGVRGSVFSGLGVMCCWCSVRCSALSWNRWPPVSLAATLALSVDLAAGPGVDYHLVGFGGITRHCSCTWLRALLSLVTSL